MCVCAHFGQKDFNCLLMFPGFLPPLPHVACVVWFFFVFCFFSPLPVYPCPLVSVRFRESVFRETGHTIMNLLAVSATFTLCTTSHHLHCPLLRHKSHSLSHNVLIYVSHFQHMVIKDFGQLIMLSALLVL